MTDIEILIALPWVLCAGSVAVCGLVTWIVRRRSTLPRAHVVTFTGHHRGKYLPFTRGDKR